MSILSGGTRSAPSVAGGETVFSSGSRNTLWSVGFSVVFGRSSVNRITSVAPPDGIALPTVHVVNTAGVSYNEGGVYRLGTPQASARLPTFPLEIRIAVGVAFVCLAAGIALIITGAVLGLSSLSTPLIIIGAILGGLAVIGFGFIAGCALQMRREEADQASRYTAMC